MRLEGFPGTVVLTLLAAPMLLAGVVPGRWEKVEALSPGTPILLFWKAGDRMQCSFERVTVEEMTVVDPSGQRRSVPKTEVLKIVRRDRHADSTVNGTLGGVGVGLFGGLALGGACYFATSNDDCAVPLAVSLAIGAAAGFAIDKAHKGRELLYKAR